MGFNSGFKGLKKFLHELCYSNHSVSVAAVNAKHFPINGSVIKSYSRDKLLSIKLRRYWCWTYFLVVLLWVKMAVSRQHVDIRFRTEKWK